MIVWDWSEIIATLHPLGNPEQKGDLLHGRRN